MTKMVFVPKSSDTCIYMDPMRTLGVSNLYFMSVITRNMYNVTLECGQNLDDGTDFLVVTHLVLSGNSIKTHATIVPFTHFYSTLIGLEVCTVWEDGYETLYRPPVQETIVMPSFLQLCTVSSGIMCCLFLHTASALKVNTQLTELNLEGCYLAAEGMSLVIQSLCSTSSLRVLNLSFNTVDSQGARHLGE